MSLPSKSNINFCPRETPHNMQKKYFLLESPELEFKSSMFTTTRMKDWFFKFTFSHRGGSRAAATSKMERFVIIVNGFQPLTIITKRSVLDAAAVLDPPLCF